MYLRDGKVGIGVEPTSADEALKVAGDVAATGDVRTGSGSSLDDVASRLMLTEGTVDYCVTGARQVVYNGHVYRTLSGALVEGETTTSHTEEEEYTPLPAVLARGGAWEVAPSTSDVVQNVVAAHPWDTWRVCTISSCHRGGNYCNGVGGSTECGLDDSSGVGWESATVDGVTQYRIKTSQADYYRLLIRAPCPAPLTNPTPAPFIPPSYIDCGFDDEKFTNFGPGAGTLWMHGNTRPKLVRSPAKVGHASFKSMPDDQNYLAMDTGVASSMTGFTVAFWVHALSNTGGKRQYLFDGRSGSNPWNSDAFACWVDDTDAAHSNPGQMAFHLDGLSRGFSFSFSVGTWQHIALVNQGSSGIRVYLDGVLAFSDARAVKPLKSYAAAVFTYAAGGNAAYNFHGYADQFYFAHSALSAAEIARLYGWSADNSF